MKRRRSSIIKRITAVPFNDALELLAEIIAEKHMKKHSGSSLDTKHADDTDKHKKNRETDNEKSIFRSSGRPKNGNGSSKSKG
jgi:hypothetical protein